MPEKKSDTKTLIRKLDDLVKLGAITEEFAARLREVDAKGLLPKTEDPLREKIKRWALESGVLDDVIRQYSDSWSFSVTVKDGWSIQFVNRRMIEKRRKEELETGRTLLKSKKAA